MTARIHPLTQEIINEEAYNRRVVANEGRCFCTPGTYCGCQRYRSPAERLRIAKEAPPEMYGHIHDRKA